MSHPFALELNLITFDICFNMISLKLIIHFTLQMNNVIFRQKELLACFSFLLLNYLSQCQRTVFGQVPADISVMYGINTSFVSRSESRR